jgi:hypothetical protein
MTTRGDDLGDALTIRDAAAASAVAPRSIRRKLSQGAFPHAYRVHADTAMPEGRWRIPVADLERAGFVPHAAPHIVPHIVPQVAQNPSAQPTARAVEHERSTAKDQRHEAHRRAELRLELAAAVADAERALLRQEVQKWRALAEERARALERADAALDALTEAVALTARRLEGRDAVTPGEAPVPRWRPPRQRVDVPSEVRDAALREIRTQRGTRSGANPRRWWQMWW